MSSKMKKVLKAGTALVVILIITLLTKEIMTLPEESQTDSEEETQLTPSDITNPTSTEITPIEATATKPETTSDDTNPAYYRIRNLWKNQYLYEDGDQVKYGVLAMDDKSMQWEIITLEDNISQIRNRDSGEYINLENKLGYIECTNNEASLDSTKWRIEAADSGLSRI
ncbi:MAG: hypothetical protein K0S76_2119, partial [Herbinix sp.]|nr:hypothetical protein [Herbinix sp.]